MTAKPLDNISLDEVLEQTIKDIGIPPRPEILDRITAEMSREDPNFRHLAHLIDADVSLAASLIKTANSPFFGFRGRVRTPQEALMLLGLDVSSRAIAGISLRKAFPADLRLERFWHASAAIAALSGWLAQVVGDKQVRPDDAHTFGLFRNCGIPVMMRRFPGYQNILAKANADGERAFTLVEQLGLPEFPIDHALVGFLLTQTWLLPDDLCLAIRHHHDVSALDPNCSGLAEHCRHMIAISQLAEFIFQEVTGKSENKEWQKLGPACLALLGVPESELGFFRDKGAGVIDALEA